MACDRDPHIALYLFRYWSVSQQVESSLGIKIFPFLSFPLWHLVGSQDMPNKNIQLFFCVLEESAVPSMCTLLSGHLSSGMFSVAPVPAPGLCHSPAHQSPLPNFLSCALYSSISFPFHQPPSPCHSQHCLEVGRNPLRLNKFRYTRNWQLLLNFQSMALHGHNFGCCGKVGISDWMQVMSFSYYFHVPSSSYFIPNIIANIY